MTEPIAAVAWAAQDQHHILFERAAGVAAQIRALGVSRVALGGSEDLIDFTVLLLGALLAGVTPVLTAPDPITRHKLASESDCLLLSTTDEATGLEGVELARIDTHKRCAVGESALHPTQTMELYTSGSSGAPRRVVKTLAQMDAEIRALAPLFAALPQNTCIATSVIPHHQYGLTFAVWLPLAMGFSQHAPRIRYEEMLAQTAPFPLLLVSTPTFLRHLSSLSGATPTLVMSAAGKLAPADFAALRAHTTAPLLEIYGSTETGAVAARVHERSLHEAWTPLPGIVLSPTQEGPYQIRAPHVPVPQLLEDRLAFLEDGRFQLLGRLDRIAKIGDKRVSLTAIEQVIAQELGFDCRAIIVRPHGRETIGVVIRESASPGYNPAQHRLYRAKLAKKLEPLALPRYWRSVTDWPLNPQGKVQTQDLEKLFECHH